MFKESLKPFVAEIDLPKEDLLSNISEYLQSNALTFQIEHLNETVSVITTQNPSFWQLLGKKNIPNTQWTILPITPAKSELKISPIYPARFWQNAWSVTAILTACWLVLNFIIGRMYDWPSNIIDSVTWIAQFGLLTAFSWRFASSLMNIGHRCLVFKSEFCFRLAPSSISIKDNGFAFPYKTFVISLLGMLLVFILIIGLTVPINSEKALEALNEILLPMILLLTLLIGILVLLFLFFKNRRFGLKSIIGLSGASIGGCIVMAYNIPLVFLHKSFYIIDWHAINWNAVDLRLKSVTVTDRFFVLVFILFMAMIFSVPFWLARITLSNVDQHLKELITFKYASKDSIYEQSLHSPLNYLFHFLVWAFWILGFLGTITALYTALSILSVTCLGIDSASFMGGCSNFVNLADASLIVVFTGYVPRETIILITDASLSVFAVLFLIIYGYIAYSRYKASRVVNKQLKEVTLDESEYLSIYKDINDISNQIGINAPIIALDNTSDISAKAGYIGIPFLSFQSYLRIGSGAIVNFKDSSMMTALLAHEMHHIKVGSSIKYQLYNILSQFALMSKSFLLILFDFYKWEYEADRFAVDWLVKHYNFSLEQAKEILITTLEATRNMPGKVELAKTKWGRFINLYFHGKPEAYFHPSIDRRLERIRVI